MASAVHIQRRTPAGIVTGALALGEDGDALLDALARARELALGDEASLLVHGDVRPVDEATRANERDRKRRSIGAGRCKRWVLSIQTGGGGRVVKISEPVSWGNAVAGWFGSAARREDRSHRRAAALSLCISEPRGYLELRRGGRLIRALQVQTHFAPGWQPLETYLASARPDERTWGTLGRALAAVHAVPFFHADLKGFHAWTQATTAAQRGDDAGVALRFIDFGRVGFRVSGRRRLINLYQALRFIVPDDTEAQRAFVQAYCRASGWHARRPERALGRVRRFLAYKLRTHPHP